VFLTVNVPNVKPTPKFSLTEDGHFVFRCEGGILGAEREYVLDLLLFNSVSVAESAMNVTARHVAFKIQKAESGPYWDRLLKEGKNVHMSVDWDNWKDEDEDDDYAFGSQFNNPSRDLEDMDFGAGDSDESDDDANDAELVGDAEDEPAA
jgi:cytosolic prostaglandin-E synthase